ncbi:hypothetical protein CEXT_710091 [Caerostris extrusa]|uniref:Uncharacterized protein n=1 Tax=Caerostris extrusa TaxID=172846 RepID=A0AAV4VTU5_CAEEX|nr:hypothetical protein CEXT_710091 [Caerostris extrusa]
MPQWWNRVVSQICVHVFDMKEPTKASNSQHRIFRILCSTPLPFNMNRTMANGDRQVTTTTCNYDEGAMLCNNDPDPTKASNSHHRKFRILCSTPLPFNMNRTTANGDRQVTTTACNDEEEEMLCNNDPVMNANLWTDGNIPRQGSQKRNRRFEVHHDN